MEKNMDQDDYEILRHLVKLYNFKAINQVKNITFYNRSNFEFSFLLSHI